MGVIKYKKQQFFNKLIHSIAYFVYGYGHIFLFLCIAFLLRFYFSYTYESLLNKYELKKINDYQIDGTFIVEDTPDFYKKNNKCYFNVISKKIEDNINFKLKGEIACEEKIFWQRKLSLGQLFLAKFDINKEDNKVFKNLSKGYYFSAKIKSIKWLELSSNYKISFKNFFENTLIKFFYFLKNRTSLTVSSLIVGMTFGRDETISFSTQQIFRILGLSHLLVASASNLSVILYLLDNKRKIKKFQKWYKKVFFYFILVLYIILTKLEPNIVRSFFFLFLKNELTYRGYYFHPSWHNTFAALLSLLINPYYVCSFGYFMGISIIYGLSFLNVHPLKGLEVIDDKNESKGLKILKNIKNNCKTYFLCQLFLYPFFYYFDAKFSIFSLPVSIFVTPFLALIPLMGIMSYLLFSFKITEIFSYLLIDISRILLNFFNYIFNQHFITEKFNYSYISLVYIFNIACIILLLYWLDIFVIFRKITKYFK